LIRTAAQKSKNGTARPGMRWVLTFGKAWRKITGWCNAARRVSVGGIVRWQVQRCWNIGR
jgi:hypothetical protein